MHRPRRSAAALVAVVLCSAAIAEIQSIPADQLESQKVYWGVASGFEKPAEVQYDEVVKATPEYQELKKKKIERGTGKYWILMSQASDRAVKAISQVGQETEYDLIAAQGYLGTLKPPIKADDVTKLVLDSMKKSLNGGNSDPKSARATKQEKKAKEAKESKESKDEKAGDANKEASAPKDK